MRRLIHNLSGASGVFGHAALSAAAMAIDDCYAADKTPEPELFDALDARLVEVIGLG